MPRFGGKEAEAAIPLAEGRTRKVWLSRELAGDGTSREPLAYQNERKRNCVYFVYAQY